MECAELFDIDITRMRERIKSNSSKNKIDWKKELKKCAIDTTRIYMIEKYVFQSPLWKGQRHLLECMKHRHITFSVKSRAVGYTSLMAALTACEMVLNCDMEEINNTSYYDIVYIAQSGQERSMFIKQVIEYINRIPKQLWTSDCNLSSTAKELHLGNSRLTTTLPDRCGFSASNSKTPKKIIYDEMVSCNDEFDFNNPYEQNWFEISDKVIIGGCANHNNEKFYNFVKDYKEKHGCFVKMEWDDNPYHTTHDYNFKKSYCGDIYSFSDEFDCEIYKLVKEKL